MLASFPLSNGLGTSLLLSRVKNVVVGNGQTWFLYSKRRLLTRHIQELLQVTPGPFPVSEHLICKFPRETCSQTPLGFGITHPHTTKCPYQSKIAVSRPVHAWYPTSSVYPVNKTSIMDLQLPQVSSHMIECCSAHSREWWPPWCTRWAHSSCCKMEKHRYCSATEPWYLGEYSGWEEWWPCCLPGVNGDRLAGEELQLGEVWWANLADVG